MSVKYLHVYTILCQVTVIHYDRIILDDGAYYACNFLEFISGFRSRGGKLLVANLGGGGVARNPWERGNPILWSLLSAL